MTRSQRGEQLMNVSINEFIREAMKIIELGKKGLINKDKALDTLGNYL
ncbi:hypothetical protein [Vulcanisaeta souniana]|uniref:Uncharacterized protein n=1 Tax=Vulcanisaeta souniana JCM 11219 TaxID=1293586 RepID=A0ABM8BLK1_9CREN|nr:hypothetical protein [Vulcanisaeta souniana]BDR91858.1 hypothetical protein Vsou_09510 [Vulcanisaeta souniana JCM 11219]